MNKKSKGSNAERELIHMFWENNWASMRAAGSGSTSFDCPDIIAGNKDRKLAIECKVTKNNYQYFTKEEIFSLRSFSHLFGSEAYVAIKFNNSGWTFLKANELSETKNHFVIKKSEAKMKGTMFETLIKN